MFNVHYLHALYTGITPHWLRSYVWSAEAVFLDPFLYVVLAAVLLLEWRIPADQGQRRLSIGFRQDLFWFVGDRIVWFGAIALVSHAVRLFYQQYLSVLTLDFAIQLPRVVRIALAILVIDFLDWGRHYVKHRVWWLWVFHAVHHSQREMNVFTDFRVHALEGVINTILLFIPLSMFGVGIPTDFHLAVVLSWYRTIYHANIRTNFGPLKYVLVTPQSHRIHHSIERRHVDVNFGVIFTFWDRIFGTHWDNYDEYPSTGIDDESFPLEQAAAGGAGATWARQMAYPLTAICRRLVESRSGFPDRITAPLQNDGEAAVAAVHQRR